MITVDGLRVSSSPGVRIRKLQKVIIFKKEGKVLFTRRYKSLGECQVITAPRAYPWRKHLRPSNHRARPVRQEWIQNAQDNPSIGNEELSSMIAHSLINIKDFPWGDTVQVKPSFSWSAQQKTHTGKALHKEPNASTNRQMALLLKRRKIKEVTLWETVSAEFGNEQ